MPYRAYDSSGMLSGRQSLATIGAMVFLATMAMASATFLTALGKLDAAAATGIIGTALGIAGAIGAATSQSVSPVAQPTPAPPTRITTREGTTVETNGAIGTTEALAADAATPSAT